MKKILGLDLGTTSIGWALVHEAENESEKSSIIKLGVRVNPLTTDESQNFGKGKEIDTNAKRRMKRSMRRNLQRYKQRRNTLRTILFKHGFITENTLLSEQGSHSTYETYHLRAKAVTEEISLEEFARVLFMINKKRGYKSSRKGKGTEDGKLIDGMEVAKRLYNEGLTPGELSLQILHQGKNTLPDFYRSDLQSELDRIWNIQEQYYPLILTTIAKEEIRGKNSKQTWAILSKHFVWTEEKIVWNEQLAQNITEETTHHLVGLKRTTKGPDLKKENYEWRVKALSEKIGLEELAVVLQNINGEINQSSGYLGAISDRSKNLYFNQLTVGQYLLNRLEENRHNSLKNLVFYRQDYLDEFETIWESQARFHSELTPTLKQEIRDVVIFYQRRLKSQKSLISICEFERKYKVVTSNNKSRTIVVGSRVIPHSSPLFQEFKIWQTLNNIEIRLANHSSHKSQNKNTLFEQEHIDDVNLILESKGKRRLTLEEKEILACELSIKKELSKTQILKLLFNDSKNLDLNFEKVSGNVTGQALYEAFSSMMELSGHMPIDFKQSAPSILQQTKEVFETQGWNTEVLNTSVDLTIPLHEQTAYRLWHLLYSFEGDNSATGEQKLVEKVAELCLCDKEYATPLVATTFSGDYGSLSAKAIKKILPSMKEGNRYDIACKQAGYCHSAASLTKEEIEAKELKDYLELLPKNSLRNPVVEKILNQMVNVVNEVMCTYGRPDEIRVELARELKKSRPEREQMSRAINTATKEQEEIKKILMEEFHIAHPSRTDVIRYRLYEELKDNGYKTLYSNTYIPREKLFSKEFDIEHIIPKARLFNDSYSNKTLEVRSVNIDKGNKTAYDFVEERYGADGIKRYVEVCESLFAKQKSKLKNLKMREKDIPDDFVERDLRNTQYIAKRALSMLSQISRRVTATCGSITDQLRNDWQLVDIMKEINWEKYAALGQVEYHEDHDGRKIGRISNWSKRNDHRHHAMDALTVAFTKHAFVQYYNNRNAANKEGSEIYAIRNAYFHEGKAISPMALGEFRAEAKRHLENILVSIKSKNKVVTNNINKIKTPHRGLITKLQQTPRGELHKETFYGSRKEYATKEEKVNAAFDTAKIMTVCKQMYREALLWRLQQFDNDPKKAFTGKNALDKNPIWLNDTHTKAVPIKVKTVQLDTTYTIRKSISPDLSINKVVDSGIRRLLEKRLQEFNGVAEKAFVNLEENPIWLNKEKGICIKSVTISERISNALALHDKRDKDGQLILDSNGQHLPVDFVNTGNNHHVAIYQKPVLDKQGQPTYDEQGNPIMELEERIVSFYEAVVRVNHNPRLPVVDKTYRQSEGWKFLYTMKQNEYFVFPNEATGFDPKEIDLTDPENYPLISPNLFRVQNLSSKYYVFRHHLETNVEDDKALKDITWKRIRTFAIMDKIIKVRINHIGQIVSVGEY